MNQDRPRSDGILATIAKIIILVWVFSLIFRVLKWLFIAHSHLPKTLSQVQLNITGLVSLVILAFTFIAFLIYVPLLEILVTACVVAIPVVYAVFFYDSDGKIEKARKEAIENVRAQEEYDATPEGQKKLKAELLKFRIAEAIGGYDPSTPESKAIAEMVKENFKSECRNMKRAGSLLRRL